MQSAQNLTILLKQNAISVFINAEISDLGCPNLSAAAEIPEIESLSPSRHVGFDTSILETNQSTLNALGVQLPRGPQIV